jgi:DNA repair exonuclease SbcCD ATPase subunit
MALKIANRALQNGDFKKALEGYEMLKHSTDDKIARKARYGLACTYLSLAENPEDVGEALTLWNAWSRQAPPDLEDEDPRILWLFLKRKILPKPDKIPARKEEQSDEKKQLAKLLRAKEEEIQRLNGRLKDMENEIQTILKRQADYVGIMESEIQTLREKIKSFEAIDQKIKEKKKEVSSP